MGVFGIDILQGNAVDGGEHDGHEEADAHKAVESSHAFDADGSKGAQRCSYTKDGEQSACVHVAHDVGANETSQKI